MGVIRRSVNWSIRLGTLVLLLTTGAVLYFSDRNLRAYEDGHASEAPFDAILVLGGGVDGDGVIGYSSRRRVAAAVGLLQAGRAKNLILSGGSDRRNPEVTAAQLMHDHAIALGALPDALFIEDRASSTFENLRFGFALAEARDFDRLAILTDAFHLQRARVLAAYFGRPDAEPIAVRGLDRDGWSNRVWSILREAMAWWYNVAKVARWEVLAAIGADEPGRQEPIR